MDKSFNGLNKSCERIFVNGLVGALTRFSKDGKARLALIPLVSFWLLTGVRGKRLEIRKMKVYNDLLKGTLPVGIGAGVAAIFIMIIFFLS